MQNFDLILVGVAIASIGILGFVVYFNDKKSITNKTFLALSLSAIAWNSFNYLLNEAVPPAYAIWVLRAVMFFAVWYCFNIFQMFYVFPRSEGLTRAYWKSVIPIAAACSILTLTPLVFRDPIFDAAGRLASVTNGPGIFIFGLTVVGFIASAVYAFLLKIFRADKAGKRPLLLILLGTVTTFALYITFNFSFPAFFDNTQFIRYGAIFTFPFVALTAYAIMKHHLLNIKVVSTEILTFVLAVTILTEVLLTNDIYARILRIGEFLLVLFFGILLIRSVIKEVKQREELQELYKKLEELSRFKTELLSLASHQLRSPLSAIKGFAELLEEGAYGTLETRSKEAIGKMKNSAQELLDLINTLLDMRKVDEGRMEYSFNNTNVTIMTKNIVDSIRPLALKKNLDLIFDTPGPIFANVDEKIGQVIRNLIDNAIKYTPAGYVRVTLSVKDGSVELSVVDTGLGISSEMLPHIFEEFSRDSKVKKNILGTGLGLYIARKIAEAHGGKVWVESAGEGKGSHFNLKFPTDHPTSLPTSAS
jgi:signal transduction histidine kinase